MTKTGITADYAAVASTAGRYMQAVAEVAKLAGDFAMSYYGKGLRVDIKDDGSPVTLADRGAEQLAREWIERHFPQDGILGEEFGTIRPDAAQRWIIDPIDGTKSFVRSVPLWGTLVAVTQGETVLAGCAYCPGVQELLVAATGEGCFWNGARCHVSNIARLSEATLLVTDDRFLERPHRQITWQAVAEQAQVVRTWGDCYGYIMVATGRAEVMVDDVTSPWDSAALLPIITESGGVFTDWSGKPTAFSNNGTIATNSALSHDVRAILSEPR